MSRRTDQMTQMYEELKTFLGPWTVGFDTIFEDATTLFHNATGYPPYNIVRDTDLRTIIEVAIAGLSKDDVKIYEDKNILHIVHDHPLATGESPEYTHKGIASRDFHLGFPIAQGVMVSTATMKDGLLRVFLVKVPPQEPQKNFVVITTE